MLRTPVWYLNLPYPNPGGKPPGPPVRYLNLPNPNPSLLFIIEYDISDYLNLILAFILFDFIPIVMEHSKVQVLCSLSIL